MAFSVHLHPYSISFEFKEAQKCVVVRRKIAGILRVSPRVVDLFDKGGDIIPNFAVIEQDPILTVKIDYFSLHDWVDAKEKTQYKDLLPVCIQMGRTAEGRQTFKLRAQKQVKKYLD